jgi:hypothetical protein
MYFKPSFLKEICDNYAQTLVGRILKNIEVIANQSDLTESQKSHFLKTFKKRLFMKK